MEKGLTITARTYAEFLNETFGTNYKGWYKSTFEFDDETTVWMIRLDSKERDGYTNYFEGTDIIEESSNPTRSNKKYRMVFKVADIRNGYKTFTFIGRYFLSDKSSKNRRIFIRTE